jgi:undecaprenyl-diphosphatase
LDPIIAALLGIVEGITEYLPVSSTGHLIVANGLLGQPDDDAHKAFEVVIQFGAILAVLVHYRGLLAERVSGLARREKASLSLFTAIAVAFVPTAIAGLALRKTIKHYLFGMWPVDIALIVGGVLMIVLEAQRGAAFRERKDSLADVTPKRALAIGLGQCVALLPGSSRSMCTIVAGQLTGLSTATAAEFSFLLGLPTLGAACVYEGYKSRHELAGLGVPSLAIGLVVSFVVAWAVIAWFIGYLKRHGLFAFGVYRVLAGAALLALLLLAPERAQPLDRKGDATRVPASQGPP